MGTLSLHLQIMPGDDPGIALLELKAGYHTDTCTHVHSSVYHSQEPEATQTDDCGQKNG